MTSPKSSVKGERTRSTATRASPQEAIVFAFKSYWSFVGESIARTKFVTGPYFAVTAFIISGVVSPCVEFRSYVTDILYNSPLYREKTISRTSSGCAVVPDVFEGHHVTS